MSGLSQEFLTKVESVNNDRAALIVMLNDIYEVRSSIKAKQRRWSNMPKDDTRIYGKQRFIELNKIKSKLSFLHMEEEFIKRKLASIKRNTKALNRNANRYTSDYYPAFIAAAEQHLSVDTFTAIELQAINIIDEKNKNGD